MNTKVNKNNIIIWNRIFCNNVEGSSVTLKSIIAE